MPIQRISRRSTKRRDEIWGSSLLFLLFPKVRTFGGPRQSRGLTLDLRPRMHQSTFECKNSDPTPLLPPQSPPAGSDPPSKPRRSGTERFAGGGATERRHGSRATEGWGAVGASGAAGTPPRSKIRSGTRSRQDHHLPLGDEPEFGCEASLCRDDAPAGYCRSREAGGIDLGADIGLALAVPRFLSRPGRSPPRYSG
jgi:hypothetical protein